MRDPLTAVTAEAEKLQSGRLTKTQARQSVTQINALSQELKRSIEDLLRIANASAEGNEAQCAPTDAGLMIEQAVGEFYDRFRQNDVLLVRQLPTERVQILADGACMWTVFESILSEFLQFAVPGTRVFVQAQRADACVLLRVCGTVREDALPLSEVGDIDLSTAIICETVIAAQPTANYCREDCRGLCPVCGKNLNDGECGCEREVIDPRLEALRDFIV